MRLSFEQPGGAAVMRRSVWFVGLLAAAACGETATSPAVRSATPPVRSATLAVSTAPATAIEDALDRTLPALGDDAAAAGLRTAMAAVVDALSRRDGAASANAIEQAQELLDVYARAVGTESGDAADLDAIALALASARP